MRFVGEAIISDVDSFSQLLEATEFGSPLHFGPPSR